jgi:hypothetical protein
MKRYAAVPSGMRVRALEALAGAAEKKRPRRHRFPALRGAALKTARHDGCNAEIRVLLFDSAVARATRADYVRHRPAFAARQHASVDSAGIAVPIPRR